MGILVGVVWSSPFRITVFFDDFGSFIQNLSTLWSVDRLAHGYEKEIVGYQGKIITIIIIKSWWSAWWQWKVQVGYLEAESWQMSRPRGQDQKIRRLLEESSSYDHSQQHGHNHEKEKKSRLLLMLRLAQMQQTQPVSWYCNLFYDAFHSAIKIFTSPLLFWVKKNIGGAFGILYPMTQEQ